MRIMGIELQGSNLNYVVMTRNNGIVAISSGSRITLRDTRKRNDLVAFQAALRTILSDQAPERIAIKLKPERGGMAAGPAALKMEGLLLANSPCEVEFISGARLKKVDPVENALPKYLQPALISGLAVR